MQILFSTPARIPNFIINFVFQKLLGWCVCYCRPLIPQEASMFDIHCPQLRRQPLFSFFHAAPFEKEVSHKADLLAF